jgi:hypothetical protein
MRVTTGSTRGIQGVCQGVSSAKTFCMSMQIWAVRSVRGPKGSASNRSVGIWAVARMPVLAIRPPRTPAPRRPLDRAAASHDLQQSRRGFDQLQPNPGWVAERFKAPVLKFDGGRPVPSLFVPVRIRFQRLSVRCDPLSSRFISSRIGVFGSKLGSRANPRFSRTIGKGRGPPLKAASSPNGKSGDIVIGRLQPKSRETCPLENHCRQIKKPSQGGDGVIAATARSHHQYNSTTDRGIRQREMPQFQVAWMAMFAVVTGDKTASCAFPSLEDHLGMLNN